MNLYLYRVREVDGDLDPIDFGVLRAPGVDAAFDIITKRLQSLLHYGCVMPVRLYPTAEVPCGIFEDDGGYIDRALVLPNALTLEEIVARYELPSHLQEQLVSALKPVEVDEQLYLEDEVDNWLKVRADKAM